MNSYELGMGDYQAESEQDSYEEEELRDLSLLERIYLVVEREIKEKIND